MSAALTMPRKPKRNDLPVKIDADVVRVARIIAAAENISMAEVISETLRPILNARLEKIRPKLKPADKPSHS